MDRLREAVAVANIPSLIPVLVQLTGDERWLEDPYRPTRARGLNDHDDGGLPEAVRAEIREAAVGAIQAYVDGAPVVIPEPSEALLVRMLSVSMGEDIPPEYGPMLRHVLGLVPEREATMQPREAAVPPPGYRAIVIGAGASGMAMAVELDKAGIDYTIIEKADAVGGTWWHNRYPGCGVDTPSHLPNFFCLYGPNLQGGHGGSLLTTLEVQARYVRKTLQEMFRRDLGSVECRPEVSDAYNERIDAAHENMVWTHPGMSTYYRNSRGRVVVNSPWRNVDFWHFARDPDLDEFIVEGRQPVPVART
jgi:hypothetical protein